MLVIKAYSLLDQVLFMIVEDNSNNLKTINFYYSPEKYIPG